MLCEFSAPADFWILYNVSNGHRKKEEEKEGKKEKKKKKVLS